MEIAADNIDKLINIEMRRTGMPRGKKWVLWEIARAVSPEPLVLAAARLLDRPPSDMAIVTGAAVPDHMPVGENDGPFGAVVLAAALTRLGHKVTIYTDPDPLPPIAMLVERAGIDAAVEPLALGDTSQQEKIAAKHDVFVAIERLGGNRNGQIYGVTGVSRSAHRANVDTIFRTAAALGKPTLGIGDGGNEIGFGKVHAALEKRLPEHTMATTTPCGGGVFSVVPTDVLAVGTTSNIGAYGVVAALALLKRDTGLCHAPDEEIALHHVGVGLGLVDGGGGERIPWCDGVPAVSSAALVTLMRNIVDRTLDPPRVRKF
ncbi:glutamate cyclase domain-containing protein [Reyranella sp.]|uniref:glutamate cyclase domain-containing protein n=1 Tax=Reyranella sp. TaxID=1929291 RepID=UPI003BA99B6F